jgi:hypothetical protein
MAKTIYVVPAPGEQVPIPGGGYLPASGKRVDDHPYWRRRAADGVCSIGQEPAIDVQIGPIRIVVPAAPVTEEV